jgi:hypothetical protein
MRTLSNVVCGFGVVACSWLAVMFVVLHRPGFERGAAMSILFVLQSLLALAAVNAVLSGTAWRLLTLAGAAGIIWAGGRAIAETLSSPHFEGFALIIGAALVLQGLLTAQQLIPIWFSSSSKVHQFGN